MAPTPGTEQSRQSAGCYETKPGQTAEAGEIASAAVTLEPAGCENPPVRPKAECFIALNTPHGAPEGCMQAS